MNWIEFETPGLRGHLPPSISKSLTDERYKNRKENVKLPTCTNSYSPGVKVHVYCEEPFFIIAIW